MIDQIFIKLFILILSVLIFLLLLQITKNKRFIWYIFVPAVLIIRDIIYKFFPLPPVIGISDSIIVVLIVLWFQSYIRENKKSTPNIIIPNFFYNFLKYNAVLITIFVALSAMMYMKESLNVIITNVVENRILSICYALLNVLYIFYVFDKLKQLDNEDYAPILKSRNPIKFFLIFPFTFYFIWGYDHDLTQQVIFPIAYMLYPMTGLFALAVYIKEKESSINYLSHEIEALFNFLKKMGDVIKGNHELDYVFKSVTDSAVENINADAAALLMIDPETKELHVKAVTGYFPPPYKTDDYVTIKREYLEKFFASNPIKLTDSILGEIALSGKPVFIRDCSKEASMEYNTNVGIKHINSIIIVPILISKKVAGVFAVVQTDKKKFFSKRDYNHINIFVDNAALSIENFFTYLELVEKHEMDREIGIAAEIQRNLIPEKIPEFGGAVIAAYSEPAKGVSGDYYDIIKLDADKIALVICDVAGKGVPAALVMVMIRSIFRLIANPQRTSGNLISWINKGICGNISLDRYATMAILIYDQKLMEATYTNAAHLPILVHRKKTGNLEEIDTQGLPVGIDPNSNYGQKRIRFNSGDTIFFCTDGITEAVNKKREQFSLEKFKSVITDNINMSCDELTHKIRSEIKTFVAGAKQHDDQTLLFMKIK